MMYIGSGDVEGNGPISLYIARQDAGHFVPLIRRWASLTASSFNALSSTTTGQYEAGSSSGLRSVNSLNASIAESSNQGRDSSTNKATPLLSSVL